MFVYSLAALVLVAVTTVQAQALPDCAKTCLDNSNSPCSATDIPCFCKNSTLTENAVRCARSSCQGADFNSAVSDAMMLCAAVSVTLSSLPTGTANASSMAASSSSTGSTTTSASSSLETSNGAAAINPIQAIAGAALFGFAALAL